MFKPLLTILTNYTDRCQDFQITHKHKLGFYEERYHIIYTRSSRFLEFALHSRIIYVSYYDPNHLWTKIIDLSDAKCCEKLRDVISECFIQYTGKKVNAKCFRKIN